MTDITDAVVPATRRRRHGALVVVPLGVLAASLLVWHSSYAAFTGSTSNTGNVITAGSVRLTDNDTATMLTSVSNVTPGSGGHACIQVSYTGTLPLSSPVTLFAANVTGTGIANVATSLARNLTFTSEISSADATGAFSGNASGADACSALTGMTTLANGSGKLYDFLALTSSSGLSTGWTPSAGSTRVFRFTWTLPGSVTDDSADPASMQGTDANFGITWQASS